MKPVLINNGYSLYLSNGHRWSILYSSDSSSTIEKMASIMCLTHSCEEQDTRLIFIRDKLDPRLLKSNDMEWMVDLPSDGWSNQVIGRVTVSTHPKVQDIICKLSHERDPLTEILKVADSLFIFYQHELKYGGLPIHSAMVEYDNCGILLAARGNTGKSTCCQRIPEPWHALCDDEVFVVQSANSSYEAHPFPTWSNFIVNRPKKSWDVQYHVPLKAIFFLEQSTYDKAVPIGCGEAASRIYYSAGQAYNRMIYLLDQEYKASLKKQLFANACKISKTIPSYILKVDLRGKFWEEIDRTLDRTLK